MDLSKSTQQFSELLNIYLLYNKYRSNSNIYWINSRAQNKYSWDSKNISLNFISCQYFQTLTGTFSWACLKRFFLMLIISEGWEFPQFNLVEFKMMHGCICNDKQRPELGLWQLTPTKQESRPEIQDVR